MTYDLPDLPRLMAAMEASWPAAEVAEQGGWRLRRGLGGGNRVSAASWIGRSTPTEDAIADAETAMRAWDQHPIFWITIPDDPVDRVLAARGYSVFEPVVYYAVPVTTLLLARDLTAAAYLSTIRLAIMDDIWRTGSTGPARWAIMDRVTAPKRFLMGRIDDRPCGTGFVAVDREIAMVHALQVRPEFRRKGVGQLLLGGAALFARSVGASWLTLAVVEDNRAARALYTRLGMQEAGRYHYRKGPAHLANFSRPMGL